MRRVTRSRCVSTTRLSDVLLVDDTVILPEAGVAPRAASPGRWSSEPRPFVMAPDAKLPVFLTMSDCYDPALFFHQPLLSQVCSVLFIFYFCLGFLYVVVSVWCLMSVANMPVLTPISYTILMEQASHRPLYEVRWMCYSRPTNNYLTYKAENVFVLDC